MRHVALIFLRCGQGVFVPDDAPSYQQLTAENAELRRMVAVLTEQVAKLERRLAADSSNPSRRGRSPRTRSGRKRGKQSGVPGASRSLSDDWPDFRSS